MRKSLVLLAVLGIATAACTGETPTGHVADRDARLAKPAPTSPLILTTTTGEGSTAPADTTTTGENRGGGMGGGGN